MASIEKDPPIKSEPESLSEKEQEPEASTPEYSSAYTPPSATQSSSNQITRSTRSRGRSKPRQSWFIWLRNNIARIFLWYTLYVIITRCPSEPSEITDETPRICKPYLSTKRLILPHVQPYYDTYAGPYVKRASPYIETVNTRLVKPIVGATVKTYQKYAAPQVAHISESAYAQLDKYLFPHLHTAQQSAQAAYDENLAVHVQQVSEAATPYYESVRDNVVYAHKKHIVPAIAYSRPQIQRASITVKQFALEKGLPFVKHAWTRTIIFLEATVWPTVKRIYSNNVRPQLVMISERVSSYQQGRKLQSVIDEVDSSSTVSTSTSTSTSTSATATETQILSSVSSVLSSVTDSIIPSPSSSTASPSATIPSAMSSDGVDETVGQDLARWQRKFTLAAETASTDLDDRIAEIIKNMVNVDMPEGQGLADALSKTADIEIDQLRTRIHSVADARFSNADQVVDKATSEDLVMAIRKVAQNIKERAQAVRVWGDRYRLALDERASLAVDSTTTILDSIRDLGLQELAKRWMDMEGIVYGHWSKYHDMKKSFTSRSQEVRQRAMKHEALLKAHEEVKVLLENAMATTEEAVTELVKLKEEIANWKTTHTAVGSLTSSLIGRATDAAASVLDNIKDMTSVLASSVSSATDSVASAVSGTPDVVSPALSVLDNESQGFAESLASQAASIYSEGPFSSASSAMSSVTDEVASTVTEVSSVVPTETYELYSVSSDASDTVSSVVSEASTTAEGMLSSMSSAILGTDTAIIESTTSSAAASIDSAASALSSKGQTLLAVEPDLDSATSLTSSLADVVSGIVDPVSSRVSDSALSLSSAASASMSSLDPNAASLASSKASSVRSALSSASAAAAASATEGTKHKAQEIVDEVENIATEEL